MGPNQGGLGKKKDLRVDLQEPARRRRCWGHDSLQLCSTTKAELARLIGDVVQAPKAESIRASGFLVAKSEKVLILCVELKKMWPVVWYTYVLTSVFTMQI